MDKGFPQKKVLSLVLCVAVMLSVMVMGAGAAFSDQDKIENTEAVDACVALNIIGGYEDGSYHPERNIKRSEITKMICVALNGGKEPNVSTNVTPTFNDVRGTNAAWAEGYIESCVAQGIVSGVGGGRFSPNGNVTGSQLAKMLLVCLGYDAGIEGFVGNAWATNVNVIASQKGLYEGLENMDTSAAITRDNAAQMVWNALNAYEVEYKTTIITGADGKLETIVTVQDKIGMDNKSKITALEDWYDVSKLEAVVVANEYGSLKDGSALKEGKTSIVITSENNKDIAYNISDATTYDFTTSLDMLGKSIVVFAKDSKTVVGSVTSSDNNVVVTTTESLDKDDWKDLLDSNDLSVPAKVQISGNYGKAAEGTDPAGNKAGVETTLIDNDDDGTVDFIIQVQSYLGKVTKYNTSGQGAINVKTADGKTLSYSDQDDVVGFADVAKDDYVIATEVCGTLYVNKAETVAGDLTAYKTNSSLTVNGEKYSVVTYNSDPSKVDSDLKTAADYGSASTLNKSATFYLDNNGYVVAVDSTTSTTGNYAFVWGVEQAKFKGDYEVKVTLSDGTTDSYVLADKAGSIGATMGAKSGGGYEYTSTNNDYGNGSKASAENHIYTYSLNSAKTEITLEEIAANEITSATSKAFTFTKNKSSITADNMTLYGDSSTVFFNVKYKDNGTDIDKVEVYTGIKNAPSIEESSINSILVSSGSSKDAAAVVTFKAEASANGEYLYIYKYVETTDDGCVYNAIVDGKIVEGLKSNDSTQVPNGVYEYTVDADGLYDIGDAPDKTATGYVTKKTGDSLFIDGNGTEYTVTSSTNITNIDGSDVSVQSSVSEDDYVVLVYDVSGNDYNVTGIFVIQEQTDALGDLLTALETAKNGDTVTFSGPLPASGVAIPANVTLTIEDAQTIAKLEAIEGKDSAKLTLKEASSDQYSSNSTKFYTKSDTAVASGSAIPADTYTLGSGKWVGTVQ